MSFETIVIYRDLPIKNGYVQIPPNNPRLNSMVQADVAAELTNNQIVRLSSGSGKPTGSGYGQQEFLRLVGINPNSWYTVDPVSQLLD